MSAARRSRELIGCAGRLRGRCYRSTGHSSPAASGVGAARPPARPPARRALGSRGRTRAAAQAPLPAQAPAAGRGPPPAEDRAGARGRRAGQRWGRRLLSPEIAGSLRRDARVEAAEAAPTSRERVRRANMVSGRGTGGRRWAASGVLLALAAGLLAAGSASEYDYVSFQSDIGSYQSGRFYTKPPQCVDIPVDLRLCHNVGYKKMVLPNLLEHETMAEVKQQASSWVPLLNKNCHIGTQVFLCSLFAPVCLDRPIYPCRWLCEAVRDSCEPVMQFFGFYWPEMLKCDKFPEGDVCIAMTPPNATEASKPQGQAAPSHARELPNPGGLGPGRPAAGKPLPLGPPPDRSSPEFARAPWRSLASCAERVLKKPLVRPRCRLAPLPTQVHGCPARQRRLRLGPSQARCGAWSSCSWDPARFFVPETKPVRKESPSPSAWEPSPRGSF